MENAGIIRPKDFLYVSWNKKLIQDIHCIHYLAH